jgi:hypothetical protein
MQLSVVRAAITTVPKALCVLRSSTKVGLQVDLPTSYFQDKILSRFSCPPRALISLSTAFKFKYCQTMNPQTANNEPCACRTDHFVVANFEEGEMLGFMHTRRASPMEFAIPVVIRPQVPAFHQLLNWIVTRAKNGQPIKDKQLVVSQGFVFVTELLHGRKAAAWRKKQGLSAGQLPIRDQMLCILFPQMDWCGGCCKQFPVERAVVCPTCGIYCSSKCMAENRKRHDHCQCVH